MYVCTGGDKGSDTTIWDDCRGRGRGRDGRGRSVHVHTWARPYTSKYIHKHVHTQARTYLNFRAPSIILISSMCSGKRPPDNNKVKIEKYE